MTLRPLPKHLQTALRRIASQALASDRGRAYLDPNGRDPRAVRELVERGLVTTRDVREPFGGNSVLAAMALEFRVAVVTDAGWGALTGDPLPEQAAFLSAHRTWSCARDWPVYRSCLARGWVEDAPGRGNAATATWRRTEAGKAELRRLGVTLRPHAAGEAA